MHLLRDWLQHPLTKGLDLDDPNTTNLRKQILKIKPLLKRIYDEWYQTLFRVASRNDGRILEIGSGAGYASDFSYQVIKTDIIHVNEINVQCDAQRLPFTDAAFQSIIMVNVLHHLHDPGQFFLEAARCLLSGGVICMVEPWNTPWSQYLYNHFNHEPFDPSVKDWVCVDGGPLSDSNQAIPWMILSRDSAEFCRRFPEYEIEVIRPIMPLVYILSGGFSLRNFVPAFTYPLWRKLEQAFEAKQGLFAFIVVRKK